ncbi:aminopeptidase N [Williamsia sp. CHRR-6]|nr:aminopeptidase N [Williamsia sp. CHRR-6]
MGRPNLTHEQAIERSATVTVESYDIDLDLTEPDAATFRSATTVVFTATPGASTFIDLIARRVVSAELDGVALDVCGYTAESGLVVADLRAHNRLTVVADCEYSSTGEGLHRFVDPVDARIYLHTQFETADATRVFACFDQPDLKAAVSVSVSAPPDWSVVSNARRDDARSGPGRHVFATTEPIATYLVAVVAGHYVGFTDTYRDELAEVPLGLYCRASLADSLDTERIFAETRQGFAFFHRHFGVAYPFGKYDQLFVPECNAGAMENVAAVTVDDRYVLTSRATAAVVERRAATLLHELAHMWFGNLVTMAWWDDLWLNESFATYAAAWCQAEATEYVNAWTTFAIDEKVWAYRQDQLPTTHPVATRISDVAVVDAHFDGITYAKGAAVIRQLVAHVGERRFLRGLRTYFDRHRFGSTTFADLLAALQETSGRDLDDWAQRWLSTTGVDEFRLETQCTAGRFTSVDIVRTQGGEHRRPHRLAVGVYDHPGGAGSEQGRLVRVARTEVDVRGDRTPVPELHGVAVGVLSVLNDDDLSYCLVDLGDAVGTAMRRVRDITDPLTRSVIWTSCWEMTRSARVRARDFVAAVLAAVGTETQIPIIAALLGHAAVALDRYCDRAWAWTVGWSRWCDQLTDLARSAAPGSDHQRAFVTAVLAGVLDSSAAALARSLLDGADPARVGLPGLAVDPDLRGAIVVALAGSGHLAGEHTPAVDIGPDCAPDNAIIDRYAADDPTATGVRMAAAARAALPTAAAKAWAWNQIVHCEDRSSALIRSMVDGFVRPGQATLLAPYTTDYLVAIRSLQERRGTEVALTIAAGLFPVWAQDAADRTRIDAALSGELSDTVRRTVLDGCAELDRAMAARAFDRDPVIGR